MEADWLCLQSRPKKADIRTPSVSCSSRCPQAVEFTHCYRPYPSDWATRTQLRRSASAPSWRGTRRRRSGGKRCVGREEKSHAALKPQVLSLNNSRFFAEIRSPFRPRSTCGVAGGRAISGGRHRFPLRGGCAFSHCRYPDTGRHGRSMGAAWNRRAGTGDASSRHFGWRQVGDRKTCLTTSDGWRSLSESS